MTSENRTLNQLIRRTILVRQLSFLFFSKQDKRALSSRSISIYRSTDICLKIFSLLFRFVFVSFSRYILKWFFFSFNPRKSFERQFSNFHSRLITLASVRFRRRQCSAERYRTGQLPSVNNLSRSVTRRIEMKATPRPLLEPLEDDTITTSIRF